MVLLLDEALMPEQLEQVRSIRDIYSAPVARL